MIMMIHDDDDDDDDDDDLLGSLSTTVSQKRAHFLHPPVKTCFF